MRRAPLALALAALMGATLVPPSAAQESLRRYRRVQQHWPRLVLELAGQRLGTFSFDGHVHTDHSRDASHPTSDVISLAELADLDALVITDHGSSRAAWDLRGYEGRLAVLVGEEVGGSFGHAVLWNVPDRRGVMAARTTVADLGAFVHGRGGLVVLAHPGWWMVNNTFDPRRWMHPQSIRRGGIGEAIDALELWNAVYHRRSRALLHQWVDLILESSLYVPIVGGSDFHTNGAHRVGTPRNVFLCPVDREGRPAEPLGRCLLDSVRAGRVFVTDGPMITVAVNGRTLGDVIEVRPGAPVEIEVRAIAPQGGMLEVYLGRERAVELALEPGVERSGSWTLRAPASDSLVRVEIARAGQEANKPPFSLVTNPVLLDVPPRQTSWRGVDAGRVPPPAGYRHDRTPRTL